MSTQKNLITLCFATVFTLGLAACGGGGGDAPVAGMMDGDDTDDTMTSSLVGKVFSGPAQRLCCRRAWLTTTLLSA